MTFFERFSVKKLKEDLEYWIFIGIGEDIIELKHQRLEYKPLVEKYAKHEDCVAKVLWHLEGETRKPWYKQKMFWYLVKLNFLRLLRRV